MTSVLKVCSALLVLATAAVLMHSAQAQNAQTGLPLTKVGEGFYNFQKTNRNWHDAERYCRSYGLALVSLESRTEHDAVFAELARQGLNNGFEIHIGATDIAREGAFYWSQTGQPLSFTAWYPGQPNNYGGDEQCVTAKNENGGLLWHDNNCKAQMWSLCELPTTCWGF